LKHLQTVKRLSIIREERSEAYANANARVSLESMYTNVNFSLKKKKEKRIVVLSRILGNTTGKEIAIINYYDFCSLQLKDCPMLKHENSDFFNF